MLIPQLDTVAIGWPITRLGVSCFPVYLPANDLPAIATGDASKLVMDELDEAAVPTLRVRNHRRHASARRRGRTLPLAASRTALSTRPFWCRPGPSWTFPCPASSRADGATVRPTGVTARSPQPGCAPCRMPG